MMPEEGEIYNPRDFSLVFIDTDSVCLVTKLNRINHRRVLIFIGNGDGVIAYAKGKGLDYQSAFSNAYMQLKQNMIVIDIDSMLTNGAPLISKYNDYRLWIYPRFNPNYWGSMQIQLMLIYTGMYHCRFVTKSRKKNKYALVYAFFMAVAQSKRPSTFAELTGLKHTSITFNSAYGSGINNPNIPKYHKRTLPK
jgi:ribosomal protein S5